jgi:cellobiose phosphorylase
MKKLFLILLITNVISLAQENPVGYWTKDEVGLPLFHYTGNYPFTTYTRGGDTAKIVDDPYFILGNYRQTIFTHVSGKVQILTGERVWGRMNLGDKNYTGENGAEITIKESGKKINLIGQGSLSTDAKAVKKTFGSGFAKFEYTTGQKINCVRTLLVKPSIGPKDGTAAFLVSIKLKNTDSTPVNLSYSEYYRANYGMSIPPFGWYKKKVDHTSKVSTDDKLNIIKADFTAVPSEPYLWTSKEGISLYEGYPPSMYLKALSSSIKLTTNKDQSQKDLLKATADLTLAPGEEKEIKLVVGFSHKDDFASINTQAASLTGSPEFRQEWLKVLPPFAGESDTLLRRELVWNAYVLHAMCIYNAYFDEVMLPQGTDYDYAWGMRIGARDHLQQLLPFFYYDKAVSRSGLRYCLKKMDADGGMKINEVGYGVMSNDAMMQSDNQIYLLYVLAEYFRITKDFGFMNEQIPFYPMHSGHKGDVLNRLEMGFRYLRDEIRTGPHGLVRLLNSDWNDDVHFVLNPSPYNRMFEQAESHVNTAMILKALETWNEILPALVANPAFAAQKDRIAKLSEAMEFYRQKMLKAFTTDWGTKQFSSRYYFTDGKVIGNDNLYLLPQAFALQLKDLPLDKKNSAYAKVKERLIRTERFGARLREDSDPGHYASIGCGENGGTWYVPNSHLILGVNTFDKAEAWKLYKNLTFANNSKQTPNAWTSYWSTGDYVCSSMSDYEGIPKNLVFCSLPHSYLLYCYFKLKE